MSGGYNPKVSNPYLSNNIPQMRSTDFQPQFFFGGSQVPSSLGTYKPIVGTGLTNKLSKKNYIKNPIIPMKQVK